MTGRNQVIQYDPLEKKIDAVVELLRVLVVVELYRTGMGQAEIGKRVHIATVSVNKMLRGIKRGK
jgi:transposase-like protein